jgi:heterotetrameric sarcosine oxidase delta subunit
MLLIRCPWCGEREEAEFSYGAEAGVRYPSDPASLSDTEWSEFLFVRANPKGPLRERWVHSDGCRRWFDTVRDTATNQFLE